MVVTIGMASTGDAPINAAGVSAATTGRLDLWAAAIEQFRKEPVAGLGAKSYRDVVSYMPDYYEWGSDNLAKSAESGGFHEAYLGLLAQRGIVGFVPGMIMLGTLAMVVLSGRRTEERPHPYSSGAFVARLFIWSIVLRGLAEEPGLFGAADGVVDFLVYAGSCFFVSASRPRERAFRKTYRPMSHVVVTEGSTNTSKMAGY